MNRYVALLVLAAFVAFTAFIGSRPPDADAASVRLVVMFASGWTSHGDGGVDDPGSWNNTWGDAVTSLAKVDKTQVKAIRYSYASTAGYKSCDTNQSIVRSAELMSRQLHGAAQQYPNARFVVVGHSLGGAVATYWAGSETDQKLLDRTAAVVTIDSPVGGVFWALVEDALGGWLGIPGINRDQLLEALRQFVAGRTCAGNANEFLPELDAGRGGAALDTMRRGGERLFAGTGQLYHLSNPADPFIVSWTQSTPNGIRVDYPPVLPGEGNCLANYNAAYLYGPVVGAVANIVDVTKCVMGIHGALLHHEPALKWLRDLARRELAKSTGEGDDAPALRLPYDSSETGVVFSGGPHGVSSVPYSKEQGAGSGIDFAKKGGFEVLTVAAGTFVGLFFKDGGGHQAGYWVLVQQDDGIQAAYWHLDEKRTVKMHTDNHLHPGDRVPQGYPIAWAGQSGNQEAEHLHLELRKDIPLPAATPSPLPSPRASPSPLPSPGASPSPSRTASPTAIPTTPSAYDGTALEWDGRSIDGWTISVHRSANNRLAYQGSAVKGPAVRRDITAWPRSTICPATSNELKVSALVSVDFATLNPALNECNLDLKQTKREKQRIDPNTAFAWEGAQAVNLPSTNCRRLTEDDFCAGNAGAAAGDASTTSTALVMDVSPSMNDGGKIQSARAAANAMLRFIEQENGNGGTNSVALISFSSDAKVEAADTLNLSAIESRVNALAIGSGTNIASGLVDGLDLLSAARPAHRIIILMTDGMDNAGNSLQDFDALAARAKSNGICIYTIGFGRDVSEPLLRRIADGSGCGQYAFADTNAGGFELRAQYLRARHHSTGDVLRESSGQVRQGEEQQVEGFAVPAGAGTLLASLSWPGSRAELRLIDPHGKAVETGYPGASIQADDANIGVILQKPIAGQWRLAVVGAEVPEGVMPYSVVVSSRAAVEAPVLASDDSGLPVLVIGWLVAIGAALLAIGVGAFALRPRPMLVSGAGWSRRISSRRPTTIGSSERNDLVIQAPFVWAEHARIVPRRRKRFRIEDRGTLTGTFVNERAVRSQRIYDGDIVRVGSAAMEFAIRRPRVIPWRRRPPEDELVIEEADLL